MEKYTPSKIEKKWQDLWQSQKIYQPDIKNANKPFYNLMMFPYPSAEGLHVGNMYAFTGADVYGRFKRMNSFDVLEPIGLDGFGIHSENYAIKVGVHPAAMAEKTQRHFYEQLHMIGNGFAWEHKLETYDPNYYKWTQWVFLKLFKAGLAYKATAPVNFCPSCKTVLADEQVIDGKCERCSSEVAKKDLAQWFFRITNYADRLLNNLDGMDWSEKVKVAQRNWIGKKTGALIRFKIEDSKFKVKELTVFTTRPDTIFGVTFLVISPEHPLASDISEKNNLVSGYVKSNSGPVKSYKQEKEKNGVFSGFYCINPVSGSRIPIWISDYVLIGYGTGAVMGVPAHDSRDFEFGHKYKLPVVRVVYGPNDDDSSINTSDKVWEGEGELLNSGDFSNLSSLDARSRICRFLEEKGSGSFHTYYHLRDWIISRQRYWGPPIPMIYCRNCASQDRSWFDTSDAEPLKNSHSTTKESRLWAAGWFPVPETDLPVTLPPVEDFRPKGEGASPLSNIPEFYNVNCPNCGKLARRETDVSDTFLDSSWYFLRYPSNQDGAFPWNKVITEKWLPVDSYIGGAEHSVLHLLYSRFITQVFYDLGYLSFEEPFTKFRAHGLLIRDGAKMSKSRGNVINPDDYIRRFGADTVRTYLMFLGPFDQGGDFRDTGIAGIYRFLNRVWTLCLSTMDGNHTMSSEFVKKAVGRTVKKLSVEIENLRFNTSIAALMELLNLFQKEKDNVSTDSLKTFLLLLSPFAPHITEELWNRGFQDSTGGAFKSVHSTRWPTCSETDLLVDNVTIVVQVNGRVRDRVMFSYNDALNKELVVSTVSKSLILQSYIDKGVKNTIFVPGKLVNFVV